MRQLRNHYGQFASSNLADVTRELVSYLLVCTLLVSAPIWTGGELLAQTKKTAKRRSAPPAQRHTSPASGAKAAAAIPSTPKIPPRAEQQLEQLARALREKHNSDSYQRLSDFADAQGNATLGARAALALGYYQYTRGQFPEARAWLTKAAADPLLADYALYWQAQTDRALGAQQAAIEEFRRYRQLYPDSVMSDTAVESLAQIALATDRPEDAVTALTGYAKTTGRASLVLLRAQAREKFAITKNEKPFGAATDYLDVVYRFPLSEEAKIAVDKIPYLRLTLGEQFPGTPTEMEIARAEALYQARRWREVRAAYQELLPKLSGAARDRAMLRIAQADLPSQSAQDAIAALALTDPDVDAERTFVLSQVQRSAKNEEAMLAAIEKLATEHPQSSWTEEALFAGGNHFWVDLDRQRAAEFYQRAVAGFPAGRYAALAHWRVAWTAYLNRQSDVENRLEQYVRQYPTSQHVVDALYWLGRVNERNAKLSRARSLYRAAVQRFPQTYFAARAADRLHEIGSAPIEAVEIVSLIPPVPPLPSWTAPIPEAAAGRWARAQALESIGFDSSAELELRAAYAETRAPKLLLAAARAAVESKRYTAGMVATRQLVPELEARRLDDVPDEAWRTAYPLPYREQVEVEARRNHLDPMLVAGLIRQESAFLSDAVSRANAVGLMQMTPGTGLRLAKQLRLRFSRARLFDPEYNLRLGTLYLSGLVAAYGNPEAALAAYNAGEDRVAQWTAGQNYLETAEFVESIPFTETREYVQIVLRNAELYRQIYSRTTSAELESVKDSGR
jgi:soluble lytic murein transglycosylase